MKDFHFLRPFWALILIPLIGLAVYKLRQTPSSQVWRSACDEHLLPFLIQLNSYRQRGLLWLYLIFSAGWMTVSLMGPTWSHLHLPTYRAIQPRVVLLDMSEEMMMNDLSPNRLSRAKFKLHDLLQQPEIGQLGLIAYTEEPFVVTPLTEDGQTIDNLLPALTPETMPIMGQRLERALQKAAELIQQTGFTHGQILVLTSTLPSPEAIKEATILSHRAIETSVMPIVANQSLQASFLPLAKAGQGQLYPYSDQPHDLQQWLLKTQQQHYMANKNKMIPLWRDQGRWFIIPALIFLLPLFRRGRLQGVY